VICRSFIFVGVAVVVIRYSSSTRTRASARARSIFPRHVFLRSFTVTRLSANYRAEALIPTEGEKNHKKGGGGVELCFQKLLSLRSEKTIPRFRV